MTQAEKILNKHIKIEGLSTHTYNISLEAMKEYSEYCCMQQIDMIVDYMMNLGSTYNAERIKCVPIFKEN